MKFMLLIGFLLPLVATAAQSGRPEECTETAEFNVILRRDLTTVAVKGFPIPISAAPVVLVIHRCGAARRRRR